MDGSRGLAVLKRDRPGRREVGELFEDNANRPNEI